MSLTFTSCRDAKKIDSVEGAIENAVEATEGTHEEAGKAIDNAVNETKEAGEATKDAIDKIGGDN